MEGSRAAAAFAPRACKLLAHVTEQIAQLVHLRLGQAGTDLLTDLRPAGRITDEQLLQSELEKLAHHWIPKCGALPLRELLAQGGVEVLFVRARNGSRCRRSILRTQG